MNASPPARSGRPKSAHKGRAILESATDAFLRLGYAGTSMDEIAARAGVSKQTVYARFGSKEDLFAAAVRGKVEEYGLDADDLPAEDGLREGLETIGRRLLELLLDRRILAATRMIIGESTRHPRIARLYFKLGPERTRSAIATYLRRQARRERFPDVDAAAAAYVFISLLTGPFHHACLVNAHRAPGRTERERHVRAATDQFLRLFPTPETVG